MVVSQAEGSLSKATKWTALENRFTVVGMTVFLELLLKWGRLVMESRAVWNHGQLRTRRGWSKPAVAQCDAFLWAQVVQAETNSRVSSSILGQQKCLLAKDQCMPNPRKSGETDVWAHCNTGDLSHHRLNLPGNCSYHTGKRKEEEWSPNQWRFPQGRVVETEIQVWCSGFLVDKTKKS